MNEPIVSPDQNHIYRIDKFEVPEAAKAEFFQRVHSIHEFLRTLPGFVQEVVLEQTGGPGTFNLITIVVWDSSEAMALAKQQADERYRETGFKPAEFLKRLGIEADMGSYQIHRRIF